MSNNVSFLSRKLAFFIAAIVTFVAIFASNSHAQLLWTVGLDDGGWPAGDGGGANASFVQENGSINPLPGSPNSPEADQQADNDYYFAGVYTTVIPGNGSYVPVGTVAVNEEAAERAFAAADNDLRYHFNLPTSLKPYDLLSVTFDANNLHDGQADTRYGIEVYINGVKVQDQIVIRAAQLDTDYSTLPVSLASVGAKTGPGFDNIVSLRGINYNNDGGGNWMGIDYVRLNATPGPAPLNVLNIGNSKIGTVTANGEGSFSVVGGGNDIWDDRDEFTYAYADVAGDFDVQVRVESIAPNARWSKGGLMVRESLSEYGRMAFLRVTPPDVATGSGGNGANDIKLGYRTGLDNSAGPSGGQHEDPVDQNAPAFPNAWLRLTRVGAVVTAYIGPDGTTWNPITSQDTATWGGGALPQKVYVGLATSRHSGGPTAAAEYRDFKFNYVNGASFAVLGADSRGNPTGVRLAYNNPVGTLGLTPAAYTLATVSGPNVTVVNGLRFTTANDAVERDPMTFTLEGSTAPDGNGPWTLIASGNTGLDVARFATAPDVMFANSAAYRSYRLLFPTVRNAAGANSMQIAEVEFLDAGGNDVTAPGDVVVPTSANSPAAEQSPNAIDNNSATKYLNFDKLNTGFVVTPSGGALAAAPTVTAATTGPTPDTVQLTTGSALVEGTTYRVTVDFNVVDSTGNPLNNDSVDFVHGAGLEARRIRISHNKTADSGYYRNSDAVAKGIGEQVHMADGGLFPGLGSNGLFEDPIPDTGSNERFSTRISGVLNITASGAYNFACSSDDQGFLYLSTNDDPVNKVQIASEPIWNGSRQYTTLDRRNSSAPENRAGPINLVAGRKYYLEYIFTEGGGGNNGSATWQVPGGPAIAAGDSPIVESAFAPSRLYNGNNFSYLGAVSIAQNPANLTVEYPNPATFSVRADGTPDYAYQWQRKRTTDAGFINIPGGTDRSYTQASTSPADDQALYRVVVRNEFSEVTSAAAQLLLLNDTTAPTIVSALNVPGSDTAFDLVYSEPVNAADAVNLANYTLNGGATLLTATLQADNKTVRFTTTSLAATACNSLTVNNVRDRSGAANPVAPNSQTGVVYAKGTIRYIQFNDIGGVNVSDLLGNAKFPGAPDRVVDVGMFENPEADGNNFQNYGAQFVGFLTAPVTGPYTFYLASDDGAQLWLSTDDNPANKVPIAREPIWSTFRSYTGGGGGGGGRVCPGPNCNISPAITLQGGCKYYIEFIYKEGGGGDYGSVAWQTPAGGPSPGVPANGSAPIPGAYLSPFVVAPTIRTQPADVTTEESRVVSFNATVIGSAPLTLQWFRKEAGAADFVAIAGANGSSYTLRALHPNDDGATFQLVASNELGIATSRIASLAVSDDQSGPNVACAGGVTDPSTIVVTFSEPMDVGTTTQPFGYTLSSGHAVNSVTLDSTLTVATLSLGSPLDPDTDYTLTVADVTDYANNPIVGGEATFHSFALSSGFVVMEVYPGGTGTAVSELIANPLFPNNPTERYYLGGFNTRLAYPGDEHEQYGARVSGLFVPPTSGNWIFYLASDDASELYLNPAGTDPGGKVKIQEELGCCNPFASHASAPQALTAGTAYYLEALYKEGGGGDFCQVAAKLDTDPTPPNTLAPIGPGLLRSMADVARASVSITAQPADFLFVQNPNGSSGSNAVFTAGGAAANTKCAAVIGNQDALAYQWERNGSPISGANSAVLSFLPKLSDDGAKFRCVIYTPGASAVTREATLSVCQANTAPQFTCGPSSSTIAEDSGAQTLAGWATGIQAHSIARTPVALATDFSSGAGVQLAGIAAVADGALKLTTPVNSAYGAGSAAIPSQNYESLQISWKSYIGGGAGGGADGYSFSIGTDLVVDPGYGGEEGAGNGLSVTVDTYDNGAPLDPNSTAIQLKWQGTIIATTSIPKDDDGTGNFLRKSTFVDASLTVDASGLATFTYDGNVISATLPSYTGVPASRALFWGRTGGANDDQWVDDFSLAAFPFDSSSVESSQTVHFVVTSDNPSLFTAQPAVSPNGTLTYTPAPNACGVANVTIVAMDDGGTSCPGSRDTSEPCHVTITITPVNDVPVANNQALQPDHCGPLAITLTGSDADTSCVVDTLTYAIGSNPAHGTLSGTPPNVTYTAADGYVGPDSFTFTVSDGQATATGTVTIQVPVCNLPPTAVISSEQLIDLKPEYENPVLLSCNWWNACLVADGWTSSDPENGDLTYLWSLEPDPVPFGAGPVVTNCLEVGTHTITLVVTDPGGLSGSTSKTIEVITAPLAIELLIEQINESHKSGVVLSRKVKRELTETLRVALGHAGDEELRATQKALDAFEKKVRAQVAPTEPEAARVWIRWSQAVSEGMEKCIKPPRKHKDHDDGKKDDDRDDKKK